MNGVRFGNMLGIGLLVLAAAMSATAASAQGKTPAQVAQTDNSFKAGTGSMASPHKASMSPRQRVRTAQGKSKMTMKKGPMGEMAEIPTDVMFKFGSSELRPEAVNVLSECAEMIRRDGNKNMQVIGHTDSIGPTAYNLGLSKRRAEAVTAWLVDKGGIAKEDLTASGVGEGKPKATNATAKGRAENRRVEVVMPMGGSPHQPMPEAKK
jgi:OOP family OmpA-OmpF porin